MTVGGEADIEEATSVLVGSSEESPPQDGGSSKEQTSGRANGKMDPDGMQRIPVVTAGDFDDEKESDEEAVQFPDSTHTYLFSEPVLSVPFMFSLAIIFISYMCLILALVDNLSSGKIPVNVSTTVRIAQYMSIIIALIMEEEIPTGLYLLRRIPNAYLKREFPEISYWMFVGSCLMRITMGYLFLANVLVILIYADGVLDIFYDVLALQFIQELDDIAFGLSKMRVLGQRMQTATMSSVFEVQFEKQRQVQGMKWKMKFALKAIYFLNLVGFLVGMIIVSSRQMKGVYYVESVTLQFQDMVWDESYPVMRKQGRIFDAKIPLVYAYFNGVYDKIGDKSEGRPMYMERNKVDGSMYNSEGPEIPEGWPVLSEDFVIPPSGIKYCDGHWIFYNENIRKSKNSRHEDADCPWLARSEEYDGFDLLEVGRNWELWTGAIGETTVSVVDNECDENSDCNLNGECVEGKCECDEVDGVTYLGTHCEVKMTDNCKTIHNEVDGAAWTVESPSGFLVEYSRPMYVYVDGTGTDADQNYIQANPSDGFALIYSGLRWQALQLPLFNLEEGRKFWQWQGNNFHAYWWQAYAESIAAISDPTKNDSPVGTDFYWVTDRGEQFGPFGSLEPMQLNKQAGRGVFKCELADDDRCGFCDGREVRDSSFIANSVGDTCEDLKNYAHGIEQVSKNCTDMNYFYQVQCCPDDWHDPCDICNAGLTVDPSTPVPNSGGHTCGSLLDSSRQISDKAVEACVGLQFLEPLCCPADPDSAQSGCSLCPNGMSDDTKDEPVPDPEAQGATCSEIAFYAATSFAPDSEECTWVVQLDSFCCPGGNGAPGSEAETSESAETTGEEAGPEVEAVDEEGAAADSQAASEAESAAITAEAQDEENKVPGETSSKVCGFCGVGGVGPDAAGTEVPGSGGLSCSDLFGYAQTLEDGTGDCDAVVLAEPLCCPGAAAAQQSPGADGDETSSKVCGFCGVGGVSPDAAGTEVPESGGLSCSDLFGYVQTLVDGAEECDAVVLAEPLCCPGAAAAQQPAQDNF